MGIPNRLLTGRRAPKIRCSITGVPPVCRRTKEHLHFCILSPHLQSITRKLIFSQIRHTEENMVPCRSKDQLWVGEKSIHLDKSNTVKEYSSWAWSCFQSISDDCRFSESFFEAKVVAHRLVLYPVWQYSFIVYGENTSAAFAKRVPWKTNSSPKIRLIFGQRRKGNAFGCTPLI